MLLLTGQWVDFSSGRAIPPTWQQFPTQNVNPRNFGENQTAVCLIFSKSPLSLGSGPKNGGIIVRNNAEANTLALSEFRGAEELTRWREGDSMKDE
jgi:hypothetical protein